MSAGGPSPDSLLLAIQNLHAAIADHQDPQQKQILAQCLAQMMKVQANDHAAAAGPAGQGGGPGGGGTDPRAVLAQMLGGGGPQGP
jgi:hypothetical protein